MANILSKITSKTLKVNVEAAKKVPVRLYLIYGVARAAVAGQSTFGEYHKLVGQFEAVNLETGEVSVSGSCFLPGAVNDLIAGQLDGQENSEVKFAFEIGAAPSDSSIGYEYTFKELVEAEGIDNLSALRDESRKAIEGESRKAIKSK